MAKFNVGDRVERIGSTVSEQMRFGRVVRVIPHPQLSDDYTEYEIDFRYKVASFYERQLRRATPARLRKAS